jgi:hypothetical protein
MKSASSELAALIGGLAGTDLLPPVNRNAEPNNVPRTPIASCRTNNSKHWFVNGSQIGSLDAVGASRKKRRRKTAKLSTEGD